MGEVQRCAVLGPEPHVTLVSTNQQTVALLAEVVLAVAVGDRGQASAQRLDLWNALSDEILMLGGLQRQRQARQSSDLSAPKPRCVHHPLGMNVTLGRADDPGAVGLLLGPDDGAKAFNAGAHGPCACGIGMGHARWIDVTAVGLKHDTAHIVELGQWVQFFRALAANLVEV